MDKSEIYRGNKLIAEFMGATTSKTGVTLFPNGGYYYLGTDKLPTRQVRYRSSWAWLMPVLEDVAENEYVDELNIKYCSVFGKTVEITPALINTFNEIVFFSETAPMIELAYRAVVKFIEWYNKHEGIKP